MHKKSTTLGDKIKFVRAGRSQQEFGDLIDEERTNISRYESGKVEPRYDVLIKIHQAFGVNLNWFVDDKAEMYISDTPKDIIDRYGKSLRRIPEIAFADCGLPSTQWEQSEKDFVVLSGLKNYKKLFAFRAQGDSMTPYINKNDLLICAEMPFENIKDYTAVIILYKSGPESLDASLKLFYRSRVDGNYIFVYSINTKHPPVEVNLNRVDKIYKLVRIIRDVA